MNFLTKALNSLAKQKIPNQNFIQNSNIFQAINTKLNFQFSKEFRQIDYTDIKQYDNDLAHHPFYKIKRDEWKVALEKKKLRKQRKEQEQASYVPPLPEEQKFVVHNPIRGIQYPQDPEKIFAVVKILGRQYKVAKDDIIVSDWIKEYDINQKVIFDQVLLVGTEFYTSLGRPVVQTAKVHATVEEQTLSEKILVFKYQRRKRYKRHQGPRIRQTVLRIDQIVHELGQEQLSRAISLV